MLRVLFNNLSAHRPRTGVGQYAAHLSAELQRLTPALHLTAFPGGWLGRVAAAGKPAAGPAATPPLWRRHLGAIARTAARSCLRAGFAVASARATFDLYHEPNFLPYPSRIPTAVTVHDLSVLLHPEWHPADRVRLHERQFRNGLDGVRHIFTVSETMRQDIIRVLGVPPDRVTGIPNGVRPEFRPLPAEQVAPVLRRLNLPPAFLLHVGTVEPRKNLLTLMRAYCALAAGLRDRCPLVLVGPWGWNTDAIRDYFNATARHRGVIHVGYLADADLPAIYTAARALVYPSHYEGFGLPPAEMLACGGAVLSSTAAALREVLGESAWFIDPDDVAGWRDAMRVILTDDDRWKELRSDSVSRAGRYTWRRTAELTLAAYCAISGCGAGILPAIAFGSQDTCSTSTTHPAEIRCGVLGAMPTALRGHADEAGSACPRKAVGMAPDDVSSNCDQMSSLPSADRAA